MRIIPKKLGLSDTNIGYYKPVPSAEKLRQEIPLDGGEETVLRTREQIKAILDGRDSRRIMNAGPCSVHDIDEAKFVLDEIEPIGMFYKDNLKNLSPKKLLFLKKQIGYKVQSLLQLRTRLSKNVRMICFGDDSESDATIYNLFSRMSRSYFTRISVMANLD